MPTSEIKKLIADSIGENTPWRFELYSDQDAPYNGWFLEEEKMELVHYVDDVAHNLDGPAFYSREPNNKIHCMYLIDGTSYTEITWKNHPSVIKRELEKKMEMIINVNP